MFSSSRDPRGGLSPLVAAVALLLLAAMSSLTLPPIAGLPTAGVCLLGAITCGVAWWRRRKTDRYDLSRLWDSPPADPVDRAPELTDDFPQPDEDDGALYCAWCDQAYAAGTYRCRECGRQL